MAGRYAGRRVTTNEAVAWIANRRVAEQIADNIAREADRADLAQLTYVILLGKPADILTDLIERGGIEHYVARLMQNQYRLPRTLWWYDYGRYNSSKNEDGWKTKEGTARGAEHEDDY